MPSGDDDWLLAPLAGEHGSHGVLFAVARDGEQFHASNTCR